MSYIGNPVITTDFPADTLSGNGSTTAFTLSRAPASTNAIVVIVSGVVQDPSTYTVSGTTLTFSAAPPTGTSNISVRHLGTIGIPNTPSAASVQYSSLNSSLQGMFVGKNRIINGAMVIDQRNAGGSVTPTADTYTLDRFLVSLTQSSKFSVQQNAGSVTPPAGFTNYLGITSLSAYSITSTDVFYVKQAIEGYNIADLAWGTVDAKTVTVSFWVRSSLTGTFGGAIRRGAGNIYVYPFTYSIPVANTWTQISVTITPPTSVWNSNTANGVGLNLILGLGIGATYSGTSGSWQASDIYGATGATSVVGTSGATFYITGVQLEVGTTATNFDTRSYGTELALCQRYYYQINAIAQYAPFGSGYSGTTTSFSAFIPFPVTMRTRPTGIVSSSASSFYVQNGVANYTPSAISYGNASANMANIAVGISATTVGQGGQLFDNAAGNSYIGFNGAEL